MERQGFRVKGWGLGIARRWGVLVVFITLGLAVSAAKAEEGSLRITVRVYDYAAVSPEILAAAEEETARILHAAGIGTEWLDCTVPQGTNPNDDACRRPFGPADLIVRILPEPMAARLPFRNITLGFALLTEEGGYGSVAGVLYHKVESLANETHTDRYHILGHGIAHEIGHLLLRTLKHNGRGLMRANWGPEELQLASRGLLRFTPEEAARLRAEVRMRLIGSTAATTTEIALSR